MKKRNVKRLNLKRESIAFLSRSVGGQDTNGASCAFRPSELCTISGCTASVGPPCASVASNCGFCPI